MKQKVSLVLSGGGARGIAHIGVIEELEKRDYEIVVVTGTSMGALVGGIYALERLEEFKNWLFSLDKMKVFHLIDFTFNSQGLIKGDRVFNHIKEIIADKRIEDLTIDFAAVAVDLLSKKEVVFRKGSIYEAIRASVAIPTVFTPVNMEETLLIDGGVLNNIPVNHATKVPGGLVVAVNVNADIPFYKPQEIKQPDVTKQSIYLKKIKEFRSHLKKNSPTDDQANLGYFDLINKTINLMTEHIARKNIEKYPPDMLIEISVDSSGFFDFYKAAELVEVGRYSAIQNLDKLKSKK